MVSLDVLVGFWGGGEGISHSVGRSQNILDILEGSAERNILEGCVGIQDQNGLHPSASIHTPAK